MAGADPQGDTATELGERIKAGAQGEQALHPEWSTPQAEKIGPAPAINPKARYGDKKGEMRPEEFLKKNPDLNMPKLPSYKDGTNYVPKTGPAMLHEGEAVVPKDKNMKHMDKAMEGLGGMHKPKKEIHKMEISKSHNGKHMVTHKHHHPEHHPDETHVMDDLKGLQDHMATHAGDGAPEGSPDAAQMTAAPSPMPQASGAPMGGPAGPAPAGM